MHRLLRNKNTDVRRLSTLIVTVAAVGGIPRGKTNEIRRDERFVRKGVSRPVRDLIINYEENHRGLVLRSESCRPERLFAGDTVKSFLRLFLPDPPTPPPVRGHQVSGDV